MANDKQGRGRLVGAVAETLNADNEATNTFEARLVAWPYCTNDAATHGVQRLPLPLALRKRLIQPNGARLTGSLCFDIDKQNAVYAWADSAANVPRPNIAVVNDSNGHAHYVYLLAAPVPTSNVAHIKPIRYLAAVQHALGRALGADSGYSGLLVKNPRHAAWRHVCWRLEPYTLAELSEHLDLPTLHDMRQRPQAETAGLGRNCYVFETVRRRAYSLVREFWKPNGEKYFFAAILEQCRAVNSEFAEPLQDKEARIIARSISRWVWRRFTPSEYREIFSRIQAAKGRKGGLVGGKRKGASKRAECLEQARAMHAAGTSQRDIAKALGVSQKTVSNWLR